MPTETVLSSINGELSREKKNVKAPSRRDVEAEAKLRRQ
jgi:hypothetical protein